MTSLQALLDFFRQHVQLPWYETHETWKDQLNAKLPGWEAIVKDPNNWPQIENEIIALKNQHGWKIHRLCSTLVDTVGPDLAARWLNLGLIDVRYILNYWILNTQGYGQKAAPQIELWTKLDDQAKLDIIHTCLYDYPGEPFDSLRQMKDSLRQVQDSLRQVQDSLRQVQDSLRQMGYGRSYSPVSPLYPTIEYITSGYIPSRQIMKLRSIVCAANDTKSLAVIDEGIARGGGGLPPKRLFPYTPTSYERELIARVFTITRQSGYRSAALPPIFLSFEAPPIFVAYPELEEDLETDFVENQEGNIIQREERQRPDTISIEELLGLYIPNDAHIILFARGIHWHANKYNVSEEMLRAVVLVHEIGHWVTHLLPKPGIPEWPLELYSLTDESVHEGWAQLITWWVVDKVGGELKRTFDDLNNGQRAAYHVYKKFQTKKVKSVMDSLEILRQLRSPARIEDWERLCF